MTRLVTDSAELFGDPEIDIIDVCTPNNDHAPLAIAALDSGKYVICEKPLAPWPELIRDMIAARVTEQQTLKSDCHYVLPSIARVVPRTCCTSLNLRSSRMRAFRAAVAPYEAP